MSHHTPTTAIARIALLAGILLAILLLPTRSYQPAHAQEGSSLTETIKYAENRTDEVISYSAVDPDMGDTVTWTKSEAGGGDHDVDNNANDDFNISQSGELTFKSQPDYETPKGGSNNNANDYSVTLRASDGTLNVTWTLTVQVTNVEEAGKVMLSTLTPQEKVDLTATLTDPDKITGDNATSVKWQWARSTSRTGPWTDIKSTAPSATTTETYKPTKDDLRHYLRATATYMDGAPGGRKTAHAVSSKLVQKNLVNDAPVFHHAKGNVYANTSGDKRPTPDTFMVGQPLPSGNNLRLLREVAENSSAGTAVGARVELYDDDGDVLTYTLTGDNAGLFTIDRQTGQISVKAGTTLNYEVDSDNGPYQVTVTATDPNSATGDIRVVITVTNVDEAPKIASGGESVTYAEIGNDNNPNTATVFTYSATDDEDDNDNNDNTVVTWSLSGADSDKFTIGNTSEDRGQLKFKASPDYEDLSSSQKSNGLKLIVTAKDSDKMTASRNVTVNVTNVNEAGTLMLKGLQPQADTSIGTTLTDPDGIRSSPSVKWKWATSTDNGLQQTFSYIQGKTSSSYTPKSWDVGAYLFAFATYRDNEDPNIDRNLTVVSANTVQKKHKTNKPPVFSSSTYSDEEPGKSGIQISRTITENSSESVNGIGAAITATDDQNIDQNDDNSTTTAMDVLIYSLEGNDKSKFNINRVSGLLKANATLDFENPTDSNKDNKYEVTVKATDPKGSSGRIYVTINVTNVNEDPKITGGLTAISTPENTATTTVLSTYPATDDEDDKAKKALAWSVGDAAANFSIEGGSLRFKAAQNFEALDNATYSVTITVTDSDSQTATQSVTVTVTNVDEAETVTLSANRPKEGVALTATLTNDPDNVTESSVAWQWATSTSRSGPWTDIDNDNATRNQDARTSTYTPRKADVGSYLRATASYTDAQDPDKTKTSSASSAETVESKDYNNTAPVFRDDAGATTTTAKRSVAENSPTGTTVGKPVAATDIGRDGRQETLTYTLTGDDASSFTIDRQTGQIRVASGATLNYDGSDSPKRSYTVNVTAKDPSDTTENPSRATIEVTISVTDVLEAPKIASGGESVTYAEIGNDNNPNTATVFTYSATDDEDNYDNNDNTVVTWSLSGDDSDKFTIGNTGEDRGQLKFKTSPDYEDLSSSQKSNGLKLTVTATDSDQITASRNVTVNVTNVNEAGTLMLKGLQPQADTSIGTTLTDPDGIRSSPSVKWKWATSTDNGLQQTFSYIQGKTSSSYSPVAGDVNAYLFAFATYRDNQDSNTDRNLTVVSANTVQAKHKTNKSPVFSHNDEDPSKSGIQISRTIPENNSASVNDGIGDAITATDVQNINQDDSTATDVLIYSLEGNDKSKFNINRVSGLLKANATLDFENPTDSNKDNRYEVTVKATDPKGSSGRIYVTITVTNVNEAADGGEEVASHNGPWYVRLPGGRDEPPGGDLQSGRA